LLIEVSGQVNLPYPGARQTLDATVTWIADNQAKGISPRQRVLTVHAHADFSTAHYDAPDQEIVERVVAELGPVLGDDARILATEVKRWRYALPTALYPEPYLYDAQTAPIYFGGDAFGGPRVEGAALSGLAIGHALTEQMIVP
jgi:predicted NAD/FAD-dependent oxidoreductase